jgi:hypothetical protein
MVGVRSRNGHAARRLYVGFIIADTAREVVVKNAPEAGIAKSELTNRRYNVVE